MIRKWIQLDESEAKLKIDYDSDLNLMKVDESE